MGLKIIDAKTPKEKELIEIIRLAYLAGMNDTNEGVELWCDQGSNERAEELLEEFIDSGDVALINT